MLLAVDPPIIDDQNTVVTIIEGTYLIEMRIWCLKIGLV
jgi:hypothetical protein